MERQPIGGDVFSAANLRNCERHVLSIQRRLDKAVADNDKGGIRETFDLLAKRSQAVRVLATWRVTHRDATKCTAGVDGIAIPKGGGLEAHNQLRHEIMAAVDVRRPPDPLRRTATDQKRPIGISTLHDRIVQEILRIALEPIVERHFNVHSYGFRPKRSPHDAVAELFMKFRAEDAPTYLIRGDSKGCFGSICPGHITGTLQAWGTPDWAAEIVHKILKSGIFYNGEVYDTHTGTPHGGVISPLLANVALTTLDTYCQNWGTSHPIVRYVDDFVVISRSEPEAERIRGEIAEHLRDTVELILPEEKMRIVHIYKGFDFLGFTFRKRTAGSQERTLRIYPQKECINGVLRTCKGVLDRHKNVAQRDIIKVLTPHLMRWAMYYRHVDSTRTFYTVDRKLWEMLYRWAKRRHPNKSKGWVLKRYFQRTEKRKFHFVDRASNTHLPFLPKGPKMEFVKVKSSNRVYDRNPEVIEYWKKREFLNAYHQLRSVRRKRLFERQKGVCLHCRGVITREDIDVHGTRVHKSACGTDNYSNLRLVHTECHGEIQRSIQTAADITDADVCR